MFAILLFALSADPGFIITKSEPLGFVITTRAANPSVLVTGAHEAVRGDKGVTAGVTEGEQGANKAEKLLVQLKPYTRPTLDDEEAYLRRRLKELEDGKAKEAADSKPADQVGKKPSKFQSAPVCTGPGCGQAQRGWFGRRIR
jgi:hypothetical protein